MKFLLDTHIWIWSLMSPEKLSRAVRRRMENPKSQIYLACSWLKTLSNE